jgi:hypothetical protein
VKDKKHEQMGNAEKEENCGEHNEGEKQKIRFHCVEEFD